MRHEHGPGTLDLMTGGLLLGYARVSTDDQELANQRADTISPAGRMVLTVFAGIAEFERSLIIDRTRSGCQAAKGVKFGPPHDSQGKPLQARRKLAQHIPRKLFYPVL